ncbi:putative DNA binding domain-containing protein [Prevotella salivae]|mgnify:FL=1|jgi:transcriptional regulator|uniref:RNA-binding domain-containing protein n=2 Tax=Prevotellaceae TaxID=171552 RepID=UPI001C5EA6BF|nr:RNA-binding domain-containing protein [Segatella salivae]MBF1603190.1 putative DNA binding domain-containing protein [Prevotella sp.]MBW4765386.1 putative DNA binding domain-containing protein [Segatella salivae]
MIDIKDITSYKENNQLEAKKASGGLPGSLWETYSSFANTDGGIILLGVDEKKGGAFEITGVQDPDRMLKDFWNTVNNRQKVNINILTDKDVTVKDYEGKKVIVVKVPRAERYLRPVYVGTDPRSGAYRRNNEGDYHCTPEEVSAMFRDAYQLTQDRKLIKGRDMSVLCMDTVHSYRNTFNITHHNHVWSKLDDEEFLIKIGAMGYSSDDGKFYPTAAGLLMFGYEYEILQEYPLYFLDYQDHRDPSIRWVDRLISSNGEWSGNVFDFFFAVSNKLTFNLPRPFKLEGIFRVDDTPLHKAVREALLNTLVNADYYGRRGVVIKKYPDGYTFENPGDFRIGVKEAMSGGVSDPRNAILFKMFALIDLGERAGSGIPTIVDGWQSAYGEQPTWEDTHNPDRTILKLHCKGLSEVLFEKSTEDDTVKPIKDTVNTLDDTVNGEHDTVNGTVNDKHDTVSTIDDTVNADNDTLDSTNVFSAKSLLSTLMEAPYSTYDELAVKLNVSRSTIARAIKSATTNGYVFRDGADKNGKWIITEKGYTAASEN